MPDSIDISAPEVVKTKGAIHPINNMKDSINIPIIVRLQGTNADIAKNIIDSSGLDVQSAVEFEEAAQKVQMILAN